ASFHGTATDRGSSLTTAERAATSTANVSAASTSPPVPVERRVTVTSVHHPSSVSLCAATTSPASRGWTVSSRSAYTRFNAYHKGLRIPCPSTAAHDTTGQLSFSCPTPAPVFNGNMLRKSSLTYATA